MDAIARITPQQRKTRRQYSPEFKQRVIQESLESNDSVSVVARRYDLNANLLFKWLYLHKQQTNSAGTVLLPVSITPDPPSLALANDHQHSIEIDLKTGRLFLNNHVDSVVLRTLIEVIRSC
jgi:transposase-like protein